MSNKRIEHDTMGLVEVDASAYWGAQTQRSLKNFSIGSETMPLPLIKALAMVKKAAAQANGVIGKLSENFIKPIVNSCDEILQDKLSNQFPLKVWQTGSGTQTNMNINEVIANRANEILGFALDNTAKPIHPNDHLNYGQSSNDCFPTAMHIAIAIEINQHLLPNLNNLLQALEKKTIEFANIKKVARTHLQDAVPMTLGQEFNAFSTQIKNSIKAVEYALSEIYLLAQGGTAVGTGLNCPSGFVENFIKFLKEITNLPFISASDKFAALSSHDAIVNLSGALNTLATTLMKIANDIRWLASGPRCGLGEIFLPENEPGSSIMPGKVNPTQSEAMTMICFAK